MESIIAEVDSFNGRLLDKGFCKLEEYRCTIAGSLTRIFMRKVQRWLLKVFNMSKAPELPRCDPKKAR